jgi:hypothetical protein
MKTSLSRRRFTSAALASLDPAQMAGVSLNAFSATQLGLLTATQLGGVTASQAATLDATQLQALGITGVTADNLGNRSVDFILDKRSLLWQLSRLRLSGVIGSYSLR